MLIQLHKHATTTPVIRASILSSTKDVIASQAWQPALWKGCTTVEDRLRTTLTPAQEALVIEIRKTLWLPLDDLSVVT